MRTLFMRSTEDDNRTDEFKNGENQGHYHHQNGNDKITPKYSNFINSTTDLFWYK